jgi:hypothetical protein
MTVAQLTPWVVFLVGVAALLTLDIGVLSRRNETMTTRSALIWSAVWISLGLSFSLAVWAWRGGVAAQEYLAGYLIEESLSIDNLFVFTAYRLIRSHGVQVDAERNPLVRAARRLFPVDVVYRAMHLRSGNLAAGC